MAGDLHVRGPRQRREPDGSRIAGCGEPGGGPPMRPSAVEEGMSRLVAQLWDVTQGLPADVSTRSGGEQLTVTPARTSTALTWS